MLSKTPVFRCFAKSHESRRITSTLSADHPITLRGGATGIDKPKRIRPYITKDGKQYNLYVLYKNSKPSKYLVYFNRRLIQQFDNRTTAELFCARQAEGHEQQRGSTRDIEFFRPLAQTIDKNPGFKLEEDELRIGLLGALELI